MFGYLFSQIIVNGLVPASKIVKDEKKQKMFRNTMIISLLLVAGILPALLSSHTAISDPA